MANGRSGTTWTDADYARAGYGRIGLRLQREVLEALDELASGDGMSRADMVGALILSERDRRSRRKTRGSKKST